MQKAPWGASLKRDDVHLVHDPDRFLTHLDPIHQRPIRREAFPGVILYPEGFIANYDRVTIRIANGRLKLNGVGPNAKAQAVWTMVGENWMTGVNLGDMLTRLCEHNVTFA